MTDPGSGGGDDLPPPPRAARGGSTQTTLVPPSTQMDPRPKYPDVNAPAFDVSSLETMALSIGRMKRYYVHLERLGVPPHHRLECIVYECLQDASSRGWAENTEFGGSWEDFEAKLRAKVFPPAVVERAAQDALFKTFQNDASVADYGAEFGKKLVVAETVGYALPSPEVLRLHYTRGLHPAYARELARADKNSGPWTDCQQFLERLENSGALENLRQPRERKLNRSFSNNSYSRNANSTSTSHNTSYHKRLTSDGEKKDFNNRGPYGARSGGSDPRDGVDGRNNSFGASGGGGGGGRAPPGGRSGGGGSRDAGRFRDYSDVDCHACGERGHIKRNCPNAFGGPRGGK